QLPDFLVALSCSCWLPQRTLCKLNAMTNALRQIEKGFLLLIMTPPQRGHQQPEKG
ncbi:hypothetical protein KR222_006959, partial [Zaprionus bogoriensis]